MFSVMCALRAAQARSGTGRCREEALRRSADPLCGRRRRTPRRPRQARTRARARERLQTIRAARRRPVRERSREPESVAEEAARRTPAPPEARRGRSALRRRCPSRNRVQRGFRSGSRQPRVLYLPNQQRLVPRCGRARRRWRGYAGGSGGRQRRGARVLAQRDGPDQQLPVLGGVGDVVALPRPQPLLGGLARLLQKSLA